MCLVFTGLPTLKYSDSCSFDLPSALGDRSPSQRSSVGMKNCAALFNIALGKISPDDDHHSVFPICAPCLTLSALGGTSFMIRGPAGHGSPSLKNLYLLSCVDASAGLFRSQFSSYPLQRALQSCFNV